MSHDQNRGPIEPQDVEELLPWYVTGRVSREEAKRIEAALKTNPDLADKLSQAQREREAVARAAEAVEPAPPETLQRLLQQVETTRQRRVPRIDDRRETSGRLKAIMGRSAVWQAAFAAACVAIVALGARMYNPPVPGEMGLSTSVTDAGSSALLVTFQPEAKAGDIAALLESVNATIVSGPKPGDAYVVQIPAGRAGDIDAATAALLSRKDLVATVRRAE
jgi:anti-sigma-K factor RskA